MGKVLCFHSGERFTEKEIEQEAIDAEILGADRPSIEQIKAWWGDSHSDYQPKKEKSEPCDYKSRKERMERERKINNKRVTRSHRLKD